MFIFFIFIYSIVYIEQSERNLTFFIKRKNMIHWIPILLSIFDVLRQIPKTR